MITLSVVKISSSAGDSVMHPPLAKFSELPPLFGVSIYSFMCHHSLPSLVTPIKSKSSSLSTLFLLDYLLITTFYLLLSILGCFAFASIPDLYTLAFVDKSGGYWNRSISLFLGLFPVFTLSSSFPIIAITLKNNLNSMVGGNQSIMGSGSNNPQHNLLFTLVTILPPFLVSVFVSNVQVLVGFTGAFAGAQIQYVIPTLIVVAARKRVKGCSLIQSTSSSSSDSNPHASPFRSTFWTVFVLGWTLASTSLVVYHLFTSARR
jgi:hypothetical protein